MGNYAVYREVQYFRQPWLLIFLAGIILVNAWGVVQQIVLGQPWGEQTGFGRASPGHIPPFRGSISSVDSVRPPQTGGSAGGFGLPFLPLSLARQDDFMA